MLQSKEKISVNIDDTSARTIEDGVYPHVNAIHGTDFTHDTTLNYRNVFADIITKNGVPITLDEKIQLFNGAILLDQGKNKIRPIDGAVEKITELSEGFDISMLTARHPMLSEYTPLWVSHHFNSSVGKVLFSNCYHGEKRTKSSICLQEGVKIMIEDDIDYSLELAEVGIKVYLLNKPWNIHRKEKHRNIVRVDGWEDIKI